MKSRRNGTPSFIIPSALLAEVLEPLIEQLDASLCAHETQNNLNSGKEQKGAIAAISARTALILGDVTTEAVPRRIWAIRNGEGWRTSTELADAILLALDVKIEDTNLPTFPGTKIGALEMIDVWAPELSKLEARVLEKKMRHFCDGFLLGCSVDAEQIPELEAAKTVCNFVREMTKTDAVELVA